MIIQADALHIPLKDKSVQCCVTSPPYYGLRDYGVENQIGLEKTPEEYIGKLVNVFREVKRVLKDDGVLWVNIGDSYNGSGGAGGDYNECGLKHGQPKYPGRKINGIKPKDLIGIPWMLAFALRDAGWYLRQDIIWSKPNPMPESVKDRCTKSHEYLFLLSKSKKYYYDNESIKEPSVHKESLTGIKKRGVKNICNFNVRPNGGEDNINNGSNRLVGKKYPLKNKRSVWKISTSYYKGSHFAVMPEKLVEPCILAGSKKGDVVLDPFSGSGTTGCVAYKHRREYVGIEMNMDCINISKKRLSSLQIPII